MTTEQAASSESEWQCQQVFLRFMQCLDAGDPDGATALVAPDVIWYRQGQKLRGPKAIAKVIRGRPRERTIRHLLSNLVVTLTDPQRAVSKAYYAAWVHEGTQPCLVRGPERIGDYHTHYLRDGDQWRIALLRAERVFQVKHDA
jgi:hypothetical protein